MHEMNVIGNLAGCVVKWGQENRVQKILEIDITCGQLRMFDKDFMQRYFDIFTRGTCAEGANLVLHIRPIGYHCNACGADYEMTPREWLDMGVNRAACIHCDSEDIELTSGGEYFITDIIADMEDEDTPETSSMEAQSQ